MRKTLEEWSDEFGVVILDPDGFDRSDPNLFSRLFTKEEFEVGIISCTILGRLKL